MKARELIGRNLKRERDRAKLTQQELADRVGWKFAQTVASAEHGDRAWKIEDLIEVAFALSRPVAALLAVPDDASPWDVLNGTDIRLAYVSGEEKAIPRTPEAITQEISSLLEDLNRAVAQERREAATREDMLRPTITVRRDEP